MTDLRGLFRGYAAGCDMTTTVAVWTAYVALDEYLRGPWSAIRGLLIWRDAGYPHA